MEKKVEFIKDFISKNNYTYVPITDDNSINIIFNVLNGMDVKNISTIDQNNIVCLYIGCYFKINKNFKESYDWHLKSADKGNIHAQKYLIELYYNGNEIVKQNLEEAKKWRQKFLDNEDLNDDHIARNTLAWIYYNGSYGFSKDSDKAIELWMQLGEHSTSYSLSNLGYVYYNDKKNINEAIKYYIMAIEVGGKYTYSETIYQLANIYTNIKDYENAMKWLEYANKLGHSEAKDKINLLLKDVDAARQLIESQQSTINKLQEENNKLKREIDELTINIPPGETFNAYIQYMEKINQIRRRRNLFINKC